MDYASLAEEIERSNDEWVDASRDLPPVLMPDLLLVSGEGLDASLADVDLQAPGVPVAWTGAGLSPVWLDIAREYTERWVHQQQIRDAIGRPGLTDREWMHPVSASLLAIEFVLRSLFFANGALNQFYTHVLDSYAARYALLALPHSEVDAVIASLQPPTRP